MAQATSYAGLFVLLLVGLTPAASVPITVTTSECLSLVILCIAVVALIRVCRIGACFL